MSVMWSSAWAKSSLSWNSCPDQPLRLPLVGRDEIRVRLRAQAQRLALGVEHGLDVSPIELPNRLCVEALVHPSRQRAGEDDGVCAAREVAKLLEQDVELGRLDVRAPFVDLGVGAAGGVDDRRRRSRLFSDLDEVVEDALAGELGDDGGAGPAAREARRHHGHVEPLQRPRDVDPFAAGERQPAARAVALAGLEVRDGERPVERRVHRHGDDHENQPPMWLIVRVAYHLTRSTALGASRSSAATSGVRPISLPRS